MNGRMVLGVIVIAAVAAGAQQGSGTGSSAGTPPQQNTPQSSSSAQNTGGKATPPAPLQPATPDELKFPEDDPAQPTAPSSSPSSSTKQGSLAAPRSDRVQVQDLGPGVGESSSKDKDKETQVDLSAPANDAKTHPQSSEAVANAEKDTLSSGGITELRSWDPHKAAKNVEVGDFYFKRKNYRAAEERYRDALRYKDNDAIATIRLAVCLEKLGILDDARAEYESYLKILPHGPQAGDAQKAILRLKTEPAPN
jgi:Tetratricopeptide repeat